MLRSGLVSVIRIGAIVALAAVCYSLLRQQKEMSTILARVAETLDTREPVESSVPYLRSNANGALSKEELRAIIREELQGGEAREATAPASANAPEPKDMPAAPANTPAFQSARGLVDAALKAQVWGDEQASQFAALRGQLNSQQFESIMTSLIPAINNQQIRVDVTGAPF